ncbi:hypothetical protein [Nonomuraea sp. NPDC001699]
MPVPDGIGIGIGIGADGQQTARPAWRDQHRQAFLRAAEAHERATHQHARLAEMEPANAGHHRALTALNRRAAVRDRKAAAATAVYL